MVTLKEETLVHNNEGLTCQEELTLWGMTPGFVVNARVQGMEVWR